MLRNVFRRHKGTTARQAQHKADLQRALLHYEARLGGELFGKVPKGCRREFFCLDERTWVWHEEWIDDRGKRRVMTTRYDVRPQGIVKSQGAHAYQSLTRQEAENLYSAIALYEERVGAELCRLAQPTQQ
jgi:hypothetical protein